jgi:hypothetical protein
MATTKIISKYKPKLELSASDYFGLYPTARVYKIIEIEKDREYVVFDFCNDCVVSTDTLIGSQAKFASIDAIIETFGEKNMFKVELRAYGFADDIWYFDEV